MLINAFVEGFKNIVKAKRVSLTAILVIYVSVFLVCIISSAWAFTSYSVRYFDNQMQIFIFVKRGVPATDIDKAVQEFRALDNVKKVEYYDQENGKKVTVQGVDIEFKEDFLKNTKDIKAEKVNFDRIVLYVKDSNRYKDVLATVNNSTYNIEGKFDKVQDRSDLIAKLKKLDSWVMISGIIAIIVFVFISTLVMANVFQIMIYNHRREIEIQRLVGATNTYIRAPFVAQSVMYYAIVGILVSITIVPAVNAILPEYNKFLDQSIIGSDISKVIYGSYVSILLVSMLLGICTTYYSINRYLKK
jgi:cell division transport system permease protein